MNKLIITKNSKQIVALTQQEIEQRQLEQQHAEQQSILDSLIPNKEEIDKAERDLETITLLQDLEVI